MSVEIIKTIVLVLGIISGSFLSFVGGYFFGKYKEGQLTQKWFEKTLEMVIKALESETKTANWIWDKDGMDWNIGAWCCSSCGMKAETYWSTNEKINPLKFAGSHFCGNCGANMEE